MTFEERERARNELYHYGVKGMKWDKTKKKIKKTVNKAKRTVEKKALKTAAKGAVKYVKSGGDPKKVAKVAGKGIKIYSSVKSKKVKKKIKKFLKGD